MHTITPRTLKMLQVRTNQMCTCFSFFVSKNTQGNQSFFLSMPKIQLKRVNHRLSRRTIDAPSTGRAREASSGPEKSLVQHEKRPKSRKEKSYKFNETKHDRFGKRPAATEAEEIDDRSTDEDVNALCRSIELFLFVFLFLLSSNNFRLAFLALKVVGQAFA